MKIVHVITDTNVGGAGILLESLLRHTGLPKRDICVVLPRGAAMAARYRATGAEVAELPITPDRSMAHSSLGPLFRFLGERRPDILHTHASLAARLVARVASPRTVTVVTRHCTYPAGRQGCAPYRLRNRLADAAMTDMTVATAHAARENLLSMGIPPHKICLIRNGAEEQARPTDGGRAARAALGLPHDCFTVGISARLVVEKGHTVLLRAAKILVSRHTGYRFLIIGAGPREADIRAQIAALGLSGVVTLGGFMSPPPTFLFDTAVNCSCGTETSCLALSEAMSLSIPCVASDYGGNPELVYEGENGLLFPQGDAEALAACIERLRFDRPLYTRLAAGARARWEQALSAPRMAAEYDTLYRALLERKRK